MEYLAAIGLILAFVASCIAIVLLIVRLIRRTLFAYWEGLYGPRKPKDS